MDNIILSFFNQTVAHPLLDGLMVGATTISLIFLPGLSVVLMLMRGQQRTGLAILASLVFGLIIALIFQYLAFRPRPEAVRFLMPTPSFPSYPSGHATAAFGVAIVIGLAYRRWHWWGLALIVATLVAISRVYLGHHYPSDILGGAVLGAAVGAACYGLFGRHRSDWRWLLWPQIAMVVIVSQMAYLGLLPYYLLRWPMTDKVIHFLGFGAVVFWLNLWFKGRTLWLGKVAIPLAILLPISIASLEEIAQSFSPLRSADLVDLTSDLLGMFFFWWLSTRFIPLFKQQGKSEGSFGRTIHNLPP